TVALQVRIRKRDAPISELDLGDPRHRALARWLLPIALSEGEMEAVDVPSELVAVGLETGVLAYEQELVGDEVEVRADWSEERLALLPRHSIDRSPRRAAAALELNPRRWLQVDRRLPAELAGRVYAPQASDQGPARSARSYPVLWVEDPRTELVTPLWF